MDGSSSPGRHWSLDLRSDRLFKQLCTTKFRAMSLNTKVSVSKETRDKVQRVIDGIVKNV